MKDILWKLLRVAVHLAVAINLAAILASLVHQPRFQTPIWIGVINLAQVLVVEGIKLYASKEALTKDTLTNNDEF